MFPAQRAATAVQVHRPALTVFKSLCTQPPCNIFEIQ